MMRTPVGDGNSPCNSSVYISMYGLDDENRTPVGDGNTNYDRVQISSQIRYETPSRGRKFEWVFEIRD